MEIQYSFKPEEIIEDFKLIGETFKLGSQKVKTGKGKRMYAKLISSKGYDALAEELINKAKYIHGHGLKNDVVLTISQIRVLKELVVYCVGL